jgi:hypothetical protein
MQEKLENECTVKSVLQNLKAKPEPFLYSTFLLVTAGFYRSNTLEQSK